MKNLKKLSFFIYLVFTIILILSPFILYLSQNGFGDEYCNLSQNLNIDNNQISNFDSKFISISLNPEYQNIFCLGKIVDYEIDEAENFTYIKAYNDQLFILLLHLILFIFFISPFFRINLGRFYKSLQIFQFFYFIIYIYFILYKFDFYGYNIQKFEPSYLLIFIFLINLKFNPNDTSGLLYQFIFFSLFGTKFFGLIVVFLILFKNEKFLVNFENYKSFLFLPLVKYFLLFISSITQKLDFLWMALIELPHSGLSRFYDLQWNLVSLICEKNINFSSKIYFSDPQLSDYENTIRSCPADLYSPIYRFLSFTFNVKFAYILLMGLFLLILSIIYLKLLKEEKEYKYLLVLLFVSPPMNFLIYQGNLDLIVLIVFSSIIIWNFPYFWKIAIVTFVGLLELHPLAYLAGISLHSLIIKDNRKILINSFFILISGIFIWIDESEWSVRNWDTSVGFGYIKSDSFNTSFGLTLDHKLIFSNELNFELSLFISIFIITLLFLIVKKVEIDKNTIFDKILTEDFYGVAFWITSIFLYENFSYRLAIPIVFFYFLCISNQEKIKKTIFLVMFLTPVSLSENKIIEYIFLILNKFSIYVLAFIVLKLLMVNLNDKYGLRIKEK